MSSPVLNCVQILSDEQVQQELDPEFKAKQRLDIKFLEEMRGTHGVKRKASQENALKFLRQLNMCQFTSTNVGLNLDMAKLKLKLLHWVDALSSSKKEYRKDIDSLEFKVQNYCTKCLESLTDLSKQVDEERNRFPFRGGKTSQKHFNEWRQLEMRVTTVMQVIVQMLDKNYEEARLLFRDLE